MNIENTKKFISYYGKDKKYKLAGFLVLSVIAGFLELLGVALIYPFIMIIITPKLLISNNLYLTISNFLPVMKNTTIFALSLGFAILSLFIIKNFFMIFILKLQTKFTTYWKRDIAKMFMKYYTFSSYKDIMRISPSDKMFYIGTVIGNVIDGFVVRIINIVTNIIVISMIIGFLLFKFPFSAIITIGFVVFSMSFQNKFFKNKTTAISKKITEVQSEYNKLILENVTNIKELKILSAENLFFDKYMLTENNYRKIQVEQAYYSSISPFIIEIFVVLSILILGGTISAENLTDNTALIASFAVVAAALFRIAPALNRIQSAIINVNTYRNFVICINNLYEGLKLDSIKIEQNNSEDIAFNDSIELKNVDFGYNDKLVLKNINLKINKGDFVGIVGLSGAGKSTLADIIMGLLPINCGEIKVDNYKLTENNFKSFRKKIGYVSQVINVLDGTFKENVTWGIPDTEVNEELVMQALKDAQLDEFIMTTYKEGINSIPFIGSNGLSQGQKQRLAIARALYRNPEIILLDEATSSLDVVCENEITEVLTNIGKNKTIIAIAHRLSTLKSCNKLVYLKDGKIVDVGTFAELMERYPEFDKIVKLSTIDTKK